MFIDSNDIRWKYVPISNELEIICWTPLKLDIHGQTTIPRKWRSGTPHPSSCSGGSLTEVPYNSDPLRLLLLPLSERDIPQAPLSQGSLSRESLAPLPPTQLWKSLYFAQANQENS
ncbi:hypothetical protein AVEN_123612-1 [Araneus ventricosus]|uniref:Uncharacterized protein n=1 Tax=Araneus ventricosus TaxID=182803 RepID=A0A4Y2NPA1_ARAVE|nr:hypothetical protein AVEN_123612-1 [Araneus ventricosus]